MRPTLRTLRAGFTLIELLAVMLIISILMAFLLPQIPAAIDRANVTACKANMRDIGGGLLEYRAKYKKMPTESGVGFFAALIADKARNMLRHYVENILPNGFKVQVVAVSRRATIRYYEMFQAARAELVGTIRTFRPQVRDTVRTRVRAVVQTVSAGLGLVAKFELTEGYPVVDNDGDACREARESLTGVIPIDCDIHPSLGGEDFAYYQQQVPGAFLFLGNYDEAKGITFFCHHPSFVVDEAALQHGVRAWIALALRPKE